MVGLADPVWIPAAVAFLSVALGSVALVLIWDRLQEQQRKRRMLGELRNLVNESPESAERTPLVRTGLLDSPWLRPLAARLPALQDAELMLQQAGLEWSLQRLLLLSAAAAFVSGLVVFLLSQIGWLAVVAAVAGALAPPIYVRSRRIRRRILFEETLPECIDLVGRALRAGHPLASGFRMAADDGPEPVASEFRRVSEEQRFGLAVQDSLLAMADRVDLIDVRILVTAILIQREVGGNLAQILDNLAAVIRARFTIRRQVRVYTAQGRMTGYLLAVLPLALFAILYALNPDYMSILFTDILGNVLIGAAVAMQLTGFLWIRKIVDVDI